MMKFTIVTGLSGAGRSSALKRLEDLKYFCVDNLLPQLIPQFAQLCLNDEKPLTHVAVAVDTRMGDWFDRIYDAIDALKKMELSLIILFLDASDDVLVRRFKATRRPHPVSQSGEVLAGIHAERRKLQPIKDLANCVIDTSTYSIRLLNTAIDNYYTESADADLLISVISFGYKRGIPLDADLVFDMRFLPNPFYKEELRTHSGLEQCVQEYVFSHTEAHEFVRRIVDLVEYLSPYFLLQDKKQLVIGIGCTGGMHRSVAIAERIYRELAKHNNHVYLEHRDLQLERTTV